MNCLNQCHPLHISFLPVVDVIEANQLGIEPGEVGPNEATELEVVTPSAQHIDDLVAKVSHWFQQLNDAFMLASSSSLVPPQMAAKGRSHVARQQAVCNVKSVTELLKPAKNSKRPKAREHGSSDKAVLAQESS